MNLWALNIFFTWDKWILLFTVSQNFKADSLWIMQMIGICGFLPTQEHEKKDGKERIKANWHGGLLCVERSAKIKHFNYCQVHSIRKQADNVLKFSVLDPVFICIKCHFSPFPSYMWWDYNYQDEIHPVITKLALETEAALFSCDTEAWACMGAAHAVHAQCCFLNK